MYFAAAVEQRERQREGVKSYGPSAQRSGVCKGPNGAMVPGFWRGQRFPTFIAHFKSVSESYVNKFGKVR